MGGPEPLQPGMIRDWMELMANPMTQDEVRIIVRLDQAFLTAYNGEQKEARDKAEAEQKRKAKENEEGRTGYSKGTPE